MFACDRILPFPAAKRQRPVMAESRRRIKQPPVGVVGKNNRG
jgi:hypothetical protein